MMPQKMRKRELIDEILELRKKNELQTRKIKRLNKRAKNNTYLKKQQAEIEKISKLGSWELKLPDYSILWTDEVYNIFELPKTKKKLGIEDLLNFILSTDRSKFYESIQKSIENKSQFNISSRINSGKGKIKVLQITGKVFSHNGNPINILGTIQDISNIKKIVTPQWKSEDSIFTILNNIPGAGIISAIDNGVIIEVNNNFCELAGYTRAELVGKRTTDFKIWANIKDRKRFVAELKRNRTVENFEMEINYRDGSVKWVLMSADLIKINNKLHIQSTVFDISDRKKTENELETSKERFKIISMLTSDYAYVLSVNEKFDVKLEWAGGALKNITGYDDEELNAKGGLEKLIHKEDLKLTYGQLKKLFKGEASTIEFRIIDKYGKLKWVRDDAKPGINKSTKKVDYIYGAVKDITEQKISERKILTLNRTLRTISEINQLIVRESDKEVLLSETCKILVEHGKFPMAWIGMANYDNMEVIPVAQYGFPKDYLLSKKIRFDNSKYGQRIIGEAIRSGKNTISYDIKTDKKFAACWKEAKKLGYNASAAFPLKIENIIVGAIHVNLYSGEELTFDMLDLLNELAGDISLALKLMKESDDRKRAQEDLKISENNLSVIFNNNSDLQLLLSVNPGNVFRIQEVNKKYIESLKVLIPRISNEKFVGKTIKELSLDILGFRREEYDFTIKYFKMAVKTKKPVRYEENIDIGGLNFYSEVTLVPVIDDKGKCIFVLWNSHDVTKKKKAEESLKLANVVIENSPAVLFRWNAEEGWPVTYVSKNIDQFGYSADDLLTGRISYASIVHPDDIVRVGDEVSYYSSKGVSDFRQEYRILKKGGGFYWTDDRTQIERDKKGNIKYYQGIVLDITERKIAEEALRKSEQQYKLLFSANPNPMFIRDKKNNRFLDSNIAATEKYGYSRDEFLKMSIMDIRPKEDIKALKKILSDDTGTLATNKGWRHLKKNGELIYVDVTSNSIEYNGKDAILILVHDVTEKYLAEKALRESESKLVAFVNNNPDGMGLLDTDYRYVIVNDALRKMNGKSYNDHIGKTIHDVLDDQADIIVPLLDNICKTGEPILNFEVSGKLPTSPNIVSHFIVSYFPIKDINNKIKWIGMSVINSTDKKNAEVALQESEERLRLALTSANQGLYDLNVQSGDAIVSNEYATMLGYNPKTFKETNKKWLKRIHPDDLERTTQIYQDYTNNKIPEYRVEFRQKTKSNQWKWILSSGKVVEWDKDGKPLRMLGTHTDITAKKNVEEALRESETRYRHFIDQTSDGFYRLTTDKPVNLNLQIEKKIKLCYTSFYVLECNDLFAQMYGYKSATEMQNVSLQEIHGTWDIKTNKDAFRKFLMSDFKIINAETIEYDKQNNRKYFLNSYVGILKEGKLKEIWGTQQDITYRKDAEFALMESEKKYRALFTDSHDCIYVTSKDGQIVNINNAGLELFGIDKEEILNQNILDFYVSLQERYEFQSRILLAGFVKDYPLKLRKKSGEILDCLVTAAMRKDSSGNDMGYQGIIRDITEAKKAETQLIIAKEQAEKADRLKTEFLAQISHEIRTPINTLLSFSSLIREETQQIVTDNLNQYFNYQKSAGNRIIRTIDLILNMSEVQTGSFELNKRVLNITSLINEIYKSYKNIAQESGLKINLESKDGTLKIMADEYSVHQIFSNLLDNSIKYTPKGSITLVITKANKKAKIEVIDTGIGIAEKYLTEIFQPFTQEEQGYTRKFEGSGLGLSLVKKYCELNDAEIGVQSKKNAGTKFTVMFNLI